MKTFLKVFAIFFVVPVIAGVVLSVASCDSRKPQVHLLTLENDYNRKLTLELMKDKPSQAEVRFLSEAAGQFVNDDALERWVKDGWKVCGVIPLMQGGKTHAVTLILQR